MNKKKDINKFKSMNYKGSNFGEHVKYIEEDDFQLVNSQAVARVT